MEKIVIFLAGLIIGLILMAFCVAANAADKKLDERYEKKKHAEFQPIYNDELTVISLKEQIRRVECGESSIINCPKDYYIQKIDDKWVIYRR